VKKGIKWFKVVVVLLIGMGILTSCKNDVSTEKSTTNTASEKQEKLASFEDVNTDKVKLIALGTSDVPVGQYSEALFKNLGIWDKIQSKISFGSTVKEVLSQVEQGSVDCGVVYATDAATSNQVKVICTAPEEAIDTPVVYPAAILSDSENQKAAKVFMNFLSTESGIQEFQKVGFITLEEAEKSKIVYDGKSCTLNIYAASSLMESLNAIKIIFEKSYPDIDLVINLDSSGTLQTQIEEGAKADIFFSAASKQMDALDKEGFILSETKVNLLENKIVLISPIP